MKWWNEYRDIQRRTLRMHLRRTSSLKPIKKKAVRNVWVILLAIAAAVTSLMYLATEI